MQRPLQDVLCISLSCHSNAQLLADSFRASNIQSWSWFHYHYRSQLALPTHVNKKVWKAGSTSSRTYFWGQCHVFFHSFQHILQEAYKQLNNHQPPAADFCRAKTLCNKFANVTNPHCHFPASWLTFCSFATAIASFKTSTLPDSMAFLSALAACTVHPSQYAFNIRSCLANGGLYRIPTGRNKARKNVWTIWDLHSACIFGQELETTKAGHQKRKMCFRLKISFAPNERLKQKKQITNGIQDKTVFRIWHFGSAPHVKLTWRHYIKNTGWNDIKISHSSPLPHCPSAIWDCILSNILRQGKFWRAKLYWTLKVYRKNSTQNMLPPLLKSPWHRRTSLRYGMGCFETSGCIDILRFFDWTFASEITSLKGTSEG